MKKLLLSNLAFASVAGLFLFSGSASSQTMLENTKLRLFAHEGYTFKNDKPANKPAVASSAFNTGGFNFFVISQVTEKLSVVGELFIGFKGDGSTLVPFNIERSFVKYAVNDYVNIRLGRMYTPLGYWNNTFNQGIVFQPTINRPYIIRNQNDKGIIATNGNGLQIDGENMGKLKFSYYVMVDNTSGAPSLNTDNTLKKAISLKLKIEPIENLQVFVSGRQDVIKAGGASITGTIIKHNVDQTILNGGVAYFTSESPIEFAAEYYNIANMVESIGTGKNNGAYVYVGYKIKSYTPYVQADVISYDSKDAYFTKNDIKGLVCGMRYNFNPLSVIKIEYKYRGTQTLKNQDVISLQMAVGF